MTTRNEQRAPQIRRPRQKRSLERYEAILDAAEQILIENEPDSISIYTIAEASGISPPSIYHFFPDGQHVFIGLAERYFDRFAAGFSEEPATEDNWQDLMDSRYEGARQFYNDNPAVGKILLGSASSWSIRSRDLETNRMLAELQASELDRIFVLPTIPHLVDRLTETIVMNDALWSLAIHSEGKISDEKDRHARRARMAHMRSYLPEVLEPRPEGPLPIEPRRDV